MARVLVADDDAPIRELIADLLVDEGYDVSQAADGAEALAKALESRPDVVVTDLMMPVLDGWEFVDQLRSSGMEDVPVVVISAAPQQFTRAEEMGVHACLAKPFDTDVLAGAVERLTRTVA